VSTSLLYQAFGLKGYEYRKTDYWLGAVVFEVVCGPDRVRCSVCGAAAVIRRGNSRRLFRTVPIGKKSIWIGLEVPRVWCSECDVVRQVAIGFADPRVRYTKAFARYALELSGHMTIQDTADHLGVSWDVVKEIQREYQAHSAK